MSRDVGYFEKVHAVRGPQINSQQGGSTSRHALSDAGHVLSSVLIATMPARCRAGANRGQTTLLVSHVEWPASGGERQVGTIFAILMSIRKSRHLGRRCFTFNPTMPRHHGWRRPVVNPAKHSDVKTPRLAFLALRATQQCHGWHLRAVNSVTTLSLVGSTCFGEFGLWSKRFSTLACSQEEGAEGGESREEGGGSGGGRSQGGSTGIGSGLGVHNFGPEKPNHASSVVHGVERPSRVHRPQEEEHFCGRERERKKRHFGLSGWPTTNIHQRVKIEKDQKLAKVELARVEHANAEIGQSWAAVQGSSCEVLKWWKF